MFNFLRRRRVEEPTLGKILNDVTAQAWRLLIKGNLTEDERKQLEVCNSILELYREIFRCVREGASKIESWYLSARLDELYIQFQQIKK